MQVSRRAGQGERASRKRLDVQVSRTCRSGERTSRKRLDVQVRANVLAGNARTGDAGQRGDLVDRGSVMPNTHTLRTIKYNGMRLGPGP